MAHNPRCTVVEAHSDPDCRINPIERVRSFGMFGRFLTVDWGGHIEVGRFKDTPDGREWVGGRPIDV